jgi:hypothetical protein
MARASSTSRRCPVEMAPARRSASGARPQSSIASSTASTIAIRSALLVSM